MLKFTNSLASLKLLKVSNRQVPQNVNHRFAIIQENNLYSGSNTSNVSKFCIGHRKLSLDYLNHFSYNLNNMYVYSHQSLRGKEASSFEKQEGYAEENL